MQPKWVIKLRIILWVILAVAVIWLLDRAIVPSGKVSYVYDFKKDSRFIYNLTPKERVATVDGLSNKIIGDPVYFSLRTPRKFETAKLTISYQTVGAEHCSAPTCLPIVEAGILADKIVWRYDLQPIENKIINRLSMVWPVIYGQDGTMLLQRDASTTSTGSSQASSAQVKKYNTIDEFLKNLPDSSQIAAYNYNLKTKYNLPDYKAGKQENKIDYKLRGAYQFYTYIKNEDLNWQFNFSDLNLNKDSDPIDVNLYYEQGLIASRHLDDTGPGSPSTGSGQGDNGQTVNRGSISLDEANLPEGIYRIELHVNDDIVTNQIITKQTKLAFINKIWVTGEAKDVNLVTDTLSVSAQTQSPASLQNIKIGDKDLDLAETYKQYSQTTSGKITTIKLLKADVVLAGDGVFSFNQESLINPSLKKVDQNFDLNQSGINYIIARYTSPQWQNQWQVSQAEFDLTKAYTEFGKYTFLISVPGLKADDQDSDAILLKEIRVDLQGKSLWQKIGEVISKK